MQFRVAGSPNNPGMIDAAGAIVTVSPDRHREAIAVLLSQGRDGQAAARRFLDYARENSVPLDAMWASVGARGEIQATVLGVPSPGRTAMIFSTRPGRLEDAAGIGRLIDHACRALREKQVELAQALLEPGDSVARASYLAAGFTLLAQLSYMQRPIRRTDASLTADVAAGYSIESYQPHQRDELLSLLDATYEDTLDCPGLVGLRETNDILQGHEGVGDASDREWLMLRESGAARGVLMLNPSKAADSVELVYLGLAPEARGKRLGSALLRTGLARLARRPEKLVTLAVDQQNQQALALYERTGFHVVLERMAMIRSLRGL